MTEEDRRVFGADDAQPDAWAERGYDEDSARIVTPDSGEQNAEKASTTQQDADVDYRERNDYIRPPYNPKQLALLSERSETHAACIDAKSMGVAGYGFEIVPHPDYDDDERDDQGKRTLEEFWFGGNFQLGPDEQPATAKKVHVHAREDYESVGWLTLEIFSNNKGDPTGLAHVPAHTIRKRADEPGYVELDIHGQPDGFYGEAGDRYGEDKTFVNHETGAVGDTAAEVGGLGNVANELIFIRNYAPLWPHYGTPDVIPALQTIEGDVAARQFNTTFFYNDGVPRFAVIVENGELSDQAWQDLRETFQNLKGQENAHRGVILEGITDAAENYTDPNNDISIRIEPLTVGIEEDASFSEFRDRNERDIIKAHNVPPIEIGRENLNYAMAREQRQEFAQETIRPRQQEYAEALYQLIHDTMLDVPEWTISFHLHNAENRQREAEIAQTRIEASKGVMTVNQVLDELGLETYDDDQLGEMLLAEVVEGSIGGSGGSGSADTPPGVERAVEQARQDERAESAGYSLTARADGGGER